mgnify:CR=1 FL=1
MAHLHGHHAHARSRLALTAVVTAFLVLAELVGGLLSGSLALLADAGHMLTDLLALLLAFVALVLSQKPADDRRTYGYRRLEILAALINGVALVLISGSVFYEAVQRWQAPSAIRPGLMAGVAALGLFANGVGLLLLHENRQNLNIRGAFLHVLGDTLSSVAVLVSAGVIALTGWTRIDPLLSMGIALLIVTTSVAMLREVFNVLLEAAPPGIDTEEVRKTIGSARGVAQVHDLHIWSITSGVPALSAHVVVPNPQDDPHQVLQTIQSQLQRRHDIDHATLQIERVPLAQCGCREDHVPAQPSGPSESHVPAQPSGPSESDAHA